MPSSEMLFSKSLKAVSLVALVTVLGTEFEDFFFPALTSLHGNKQCISDYTAGEKKPLQKCKGGLLQVQKRVWVGSVLIPGVCLLFSGPTVFPSRLLVFLLRQK